MIMGFGYSESSSSVNGKGKSMVGLLDSFSEFRELPSELLAVSTMGASGCGSGVGFVCSFGSLGLGMFVVSEGLGDGGKTKDSPLFSMVMTELYQRERERERERKSKSSEIQM